MALDDFLKECKQKGIIPLDYKRRSKDVHGNVSREKYVNPEFASLNPSLHSKKTGKAEDLLSMLYDEDIVIHTRDGYHYGRLKGYDGKSFYLEDYLFNRNLIDVFDYADASFGKKDGVVPAYNIFSIAMIPLQVDKQKEPGYSQAYS